MITKLLNLNIGARTTKRLFTRKATNPFAASKFKQLESDIFSQRKLPAPNCAGSFCINSLLKKALSSIDIYSLNILVKPRKNMVKIKKMPMLTEGLNIVLKDIPEFMNIFKPKKRYHEGLDRHVLATFQQLLSHKDYHSLSLREQKVLELATLLHDVGKAFDLGEVHPELSAKIVAKRLRSKQLPKEDKLLIVKLIRHHHYSENIAKKRMSYRDYTEIFEEEEFKLLKILIDSDIKSKRKPVQYRLDENAVFFAEQDALFKSKKKMKCGYLDIRA